MRNIICIGLISLSFIAYGQIQKGAEIIDLNFSYILSNSETIGALDGTLRTFRTESRTINILPNIGIAIKKNQLLYIGANLLFNKGTNNRFFSSGFTQLVTTNNVYSFVLGYERLLQIENRLFIAPSLSGSIGFGKRKGEDFSGEVDNSIVQYRVSLAPRMYYFANEKWALTGSIGFIEYRRNEEKIDVPNGEDLKAINQNFQSTFGLNSWRLGVRFILNNSSD
ncbi:hypothetical protein [Ekhidna sp.]